MEELHGCGLQLLRTASRQLGGSLDLGLGANESILTMRLPLNWY